MANRPDELAQQLNAAKRMLRQLEESLTKTQLLIKQTRQILDQAAPEDTNGRSANHKHTA